MLNLFRKSVEEKAILSEKDIDKLIDALKNNADYKMRTAAVRSIEKMEGGVNDAAVDALVYAGSHDEDGRVRWAARGALLKHKDEPTGRAHSALLSLDKKWDAVGQGLPVWANASPTYRFNLPQMCVCCGALPSEGGLGEFVVSVPGHYYGPMRLSTMQRSRVWWQLKFPCCKTCFLHLKKHEPKVTRDCTGFTDPVRCTKSWDKDDLKLFNFTFTNRVYAEAFAKANSGQTEAPKPRQDVIYL